MNTFESALFKLYFFSLLQMIFLFKKNATQSTEAWSYDFYKAGNAVDRNISTCMRTKEIGRNSPEKTVWWKVDLGGMLNIHSVNILFKNYNGYGKITADFIHI